MTHNSDLTNGASLEDCHTNFFALADLSGIKWRRLCVDTHCSDYLEDPILISYSKCLSAGILCVWRRVAVQKSGHHDMNSLSYHKELWVFWYGDEPDFSGLIKPNLTEADEGSWESGLSYECRTLLFKALHNLIERCLLSKGFTRIGRYFIEPLILSSASNKRASIAFALDFLVHGDSTVCASIDARSVSPLYALHECHMTAAQIGQKEIKVILSPFGIEGKLTGHGYKYNDPHMPQFLNEWYQFYPHPNRKDTSNMNSSLQNVIEVVAGGVRMKYPASYVFVAEEDHLEAFQETKNVSNVATVTKEPLHISKQAPTTLLTPPLSPCEFSSSSDNSNKSTYNGKLIFHNCESPLKKQVPFIQDIIKQSVSQECCLPVQSNKTEENNVLWDFQDPSAIIKCGCPRIPKKMSSHKSAISAEVRSENTNNQSSRFEDKSNKFHSIPFHRQKLAKRKSSNFLSQNDCSASKHKNSVLSNEAKSHGSSVTMGASSNNLPLLHIPSQSTSFESLPNGQSSDLCFSRMSFTDPAMPTLSPQTPVIKEEDSVHPFEIQSQAASTSPCADNRHVKKEKYNFDEVLSPFHTSLLAMFENSKPLSKAELDQASDDNKGDSCQHVPVENQLVSQVIQRPQLPKRAHEDFISPSPMIGPLYDYTCLNSQVGLFSKRRCVTPLHMQDIYNLEEDNEVVFGVDGAHRENLSCIPKDPYEFTEFDETALSERGFRPKSENSKDEDKSIQSNCSMPVDPSPIASPVSVPQDASSVHEELKAPSPAITKNFCSKLLREEDLTVSLHDLDNIFDTSSSEEDNGSPSRIDDFSGKSKISCSGMIELSRMYPTPPSLEQNAVPSPLGTVASNENGMLENDVFKEPNDDEQNSFEKLEAKGIFVWKPSHLYQFMESPNYTCLTSVPSPAEDKIPPDCLYRVSWLQNVEHSTMILDNTTGCENNQNGLKSQAFGNCYFPENERLLPSSYVNTTALEPSLGQQSYDMGSPMNITSYQKSSAEDSSLHNTSEVNSLIVNLLLSDSMLNISKDHNFESCCLCVCNMNIKGADAGIILPSALIPSGNDEPQYKCMCGFSAVVYRHRSFNSGLFYEDELEVTGFDCDKSRTCKYFPTKFSEEGASEQKEMPPRTDFVPPFVLDLLRIQCKMMCSSFSLFHKSNVPYRTDNSPLWNSLELHDGCEVCFQAFEDSKNAIQTVPSKLDENSKSSCLHKWPYLSTPLLSTSQELMLYLDSLKPILQTAVHKKNTQRMWDVTYVVSGPLTWREFHQLAAKGNEDQCEPQPIPSLMIGYDKDYLALSPFALRYWDKLHLEPYSLPRDVAYIVVSPENDTILSHIKNFFKELSCTYESHKLGKHIPVTKVLRDGIMRVGKNAASKLAEEPISEWFNSIGEGPIANKLKLFARVCKHRLAPHLSTLCLDKTIFENDSVSKHSENPTGNSTSVPFTSETNNRTPGFNARPAENDSCNETASSANTSTDAADVDDNDPPALVVYIVEPFTFSQCDPNLYRMVTLAMLHSYAEMVEFLPEVIRNSIHLQLLSLDSIMCMESNQVILRKKDQMKTLAFSVYSQSHQLITHQPTVTSLTGFGPAAARDAFIDSRNLKTPISTKTFNRPFVLASMKDKQTELGEMFGDRKQKCDILHCSYCLTEDRRFILASCTNDKGEFTETTTINISIPNRSRRKFTSVRRFGLRKLLDFIIEVISGFAHPWRIIIERFGKLGHGELKVWASLLSKKSIQSHTHQLWDLCGQCTILGSNDVPSIFSICLVSLEPDSALRIMSDQYTPDDHFNNSSCNTCQLSTPEDATCTHILVFPTSATTQLSHGTFQQEHTLPGGLGEDIFDVLSEDDINVGQDMNDIFGWTESPTQSPGNSPTHGDNMQPSSPGTSNRLHGHHNDFNRRESLVSETQDELLQLLQQPLALGYYVSTAQTGPLPKWFWSSCPHAASKSPVFLKSALLIHLPYVQQNSDDILHSNPQQQQICHPLDSNYTTDVLRYVLESHNALSWLSLDPNGRDRRSCLPVHIQLLMQLYSIVEAIL